MMPSLASVIECLRSLDAENRMLKEDLSNLHQKFQLALTKQKLCTESLLDIIEANVDELPECPKMSFPEFNEGD
jgi:hypothetical protein